MYEAALHVLHMYSSTTRDCSVGICAFRLEVAFIANTIHEVTVHQYEKGHERCRDTVGAGVGTQD